MIDRSRASAGLARVNGHVHVHVHGARRTDRERDRRTGRDTGTAGEQARRQRDRGLRAGSAPAESGGVTSFGSLRRGSPPLV